MEYRDVFDVLLDGHCEEGVDSSCQGVCARKGRWRRAACVRVCCVLPANMPTMNTTAKSRIPVVDVKTYGKKPTTLVAQLKSTACQVS